MELGRKNTHEHRDVHNVSQDSDRIVQSVSPVSGQSSKENWSKAICWAVVVERFLAGLGNESIRLIYMKSWKWLSVRWCYQGYDRERVQALTSPLTNLLHQEVLWEFGCPGPCSHFSKSDSLWVSPQDLPVFFIALFLLSYILIIYSCLIIVQLT